MVDTTLDFYNQHADAFCAQTVDADMQAARGRFLKYVPQGGRVLDFGCGSGRDTRYFVERGYATEALDGSEELAKYASAYAGIDVRCMRFQEFSAADAYDGIWACSSILHLDKKDLAMVMSRMAEALRHEGVIYTSFKYGEFEGVRGERYFTDFTEEGFREFISGMKLTIEEMWLSEDVRPERAGEKWLNVIMKRAENTT